MKKTKTRVSIGVLLVIMLIVTTIFFGSAFAQNEEIQEEIVTIYRRESLGDELTPVQLYKVEAEAYLESLKRPKPQMETIKFYGNNLKFNSIAERLAFVNSDLKNFSSGINLDKFIFPKGPITSYGIDHEAYIFVGFKKGESISEQLMDEIYKTIQQQAENNGLEHISVVFEYTPEVKPDSRSDVHRPLKGGIRVEALSGSATTLGWAGKKTTDGSKGFLVSAHFASFIGVEIYQPNTSSSSYRVGHVSKVGGPYADASWVATTDVRGKVYVTSSLDKLVDGYGDPTIGQYVQKSGITTGVTGGYVTRKLDYIDWPYIPKGYLKDQYISDYGSSAGDSGSPVYYTNTTDYCKIRGVHVGSYDLWYKIFSPVSGVQTDLEVVPLRYWE